MSNHPLQQIRDAERASKERLLAAKDHARAELSAAEAEAEALVAAARERGQRAADDAHERGVLEAEAEVGRRLEDARNRAEQIEVQGMAQLDHVVARLVRHVLPEVD